MQSSSRLFPVQLVSAELIGTLVEDIYLLKPNNSSDRSVELAVTRLSKDNDHGQPIILLHGSFSNRRHWLSAEGKGVAAYLVEAGYDVWLPEMRGHGLSPVNNDFTNNSLDRIIEYDLPAIHKFVAEQTGKEIAWIAEELGGFLIMSALALGVIDQKTVSNCVYLEETTPLSLHLNNSKVYSKTALWRWKKPGVINGRSLKLGAENESYPVIKEFLRWQNNLKYSYPKGLSLDDAFKNITVPTMVIGTNKSTQSAIRNTQWIYNQLSSTPKILKEYDCALPSHQNIYDEGGGTLSASASGCWGDIVYWLEKQYSCLGQATERVFCNE
jgi:esterase/lipase